MDIRCDLASCGRLLARSDGLTLTIACPRCGRRREVLVTDLIIELQVYLAELQAAAAGDKQSGGGFLL